MTIIGVIDLRHGRAVHAVAGDRANYQPIENGDAVALAAGYCSHPDVSALYVADLDAIEQRAPNAAIVRSLAALGRPVWLDAGITTVAQASQARALGAAKVVVGLETLASFDALHDICAAVGGDRVAFSLDLRSGEPIVGSSLLPRGTPEELAARAVQAGAATVIVLDLARVGTSTGIDVGLLRRVRASVPGAPLVAGGGIGELGDVRLLGGGLCEAVLVGSALRAWSANRRPAPPTSSSKPCTTTPAGAANREQNPS